MSEFLDETHCFWVTCSHPCCWEAEQRVARGVARRTQSRTPGRSNVSSVTEEEVPTLNIVNVSEWAKTRTSPKKNMLYRAFCSESCHSVASQSQLYSQSQNFRKDSDVRLESLKDLPFPELTPAAGGSHSTNYKGNKDVKLSLAQISPLDRSSGALCGSVSMVVWIPNPKRISHGPAHPRRKSPHIAVRNVSCVPSSRLCDIPKVNKKKSRNAKKAEHLQLACTQLASSNERPSAPAEAELIAGGNQGVLQLEPLAEPRAGPHPGPAAGKPGFCLGNEPMVVHSIRQREPAQRTQTRLAQCRLDSVNVPEGADWRRLRSQAYLWKKRSLQQNCNKDTLVFAPPQPPRHRAATHRLSKATLHHHHRSALEIGPECCCAQCAERSQSFRPMHYSSLPPLDADNISDRKLTGRNTNISCTSALERVDSTATLQASSECRVPAGKGREAAGRGPGRSLSQGTRDRDSGSDSDSEEGDFGPSESHLSAPPPSLRSDMIE